MVQDEYEIDIMQVLYILVQFVPFKVRASSRTHAIFKTADDREMFYHQIGSNRLMACQTQPPFVNTSVTTFTAVRCCAITRAGHRCSISSTSHCRDQRTGRLAARPLQQGSRHCLFHARPFCRVDENLLRFQSSQPPVIIYFDLETTSLDPVTTNIIEVGAVSHHCDAAFSSLVQPKGKLDPAASAVTGITTEIHLT